MVTQPIGVDEIEERMDESAQAVQNCVEVLRRNIPWLAEVLTEENRAAGMLITYPIEPVPAQYNQDGTIAVNSKPGVLRPVMDEAELKRYTDALADLEKAGDALDKPAREGGKSKVDAVRPLIRRRRRQLPGGILG